MDITKVTKCKCIKSIWNLNCGDITAFKFENGIYHFLAMLILLGNAETDESIFWDYWGDDPKDIQDFLYHFELIDPDPSIIKPNYNYLIPLLTELNTT